MNINILKKLKEGTNYFEYYLNNTLIKKTFSQAHHDVVLIIEYFLKLNIKFGDKIGIKATNSYYWVILDLACFSQGISLIPIDINLKNSETQSLVNDFELSHLFLNKKNNDLKCEQILISELELLLKTQTESKISTDKQVNDYHYSDNDIILFGTTSGTTSSPKHIGYRKKWMVNLITNSNSIFRFTKEDKFLIFLPLHVILQRVYVYFSIIYGCNLLILRNEQLMSGMETGKPTVIVAIPAFYEAFHNAFINKIQSNVFIYFIFKSFLVFRKVGILKKFTPFLKIFGGKVKFFMSGSAPLKPKEIHFYKQIGFELYEGYGMSEAGMISLNAPGSSKKGSVGKIFADKEIIINHEGEIIVKSDFFPNNQYYFPKDNADNSVFKENNIIHTGDIGYLDEEGYLFLSGRKDNVIILNNGYKVSPESIEKVFNNALLGISGVFISGENKDFLVMLIFSKNEQNLKKLQSQIDNVNENLREYQKVLKFKHIKTDLEVTNNTLTSSLKLNRKFIMENYKNEIDLIYKI